MSHFVVLKVMLDLTREGVRSVEGSLVIRIGMKASLKDGLRVNSEKGKGVSLATI